MVAHGMNARLARMATLACATMLLVGAADETRFALPPAPPRLHRPAQGVLFADDFTSDGLHDWTPDRSGVWSLWHGMLRADLPDQRQLRSIIAAGDTAWTDIAL